MTDHLARGDRVFKLNKPGGRNLAGPEVGTVESVSHKRAKVLWPGFPCAITENTNTLVRFDGRPYEQEALPT